MTTNSINHASENQLNDPQLIEVEVAYATPATQRILKICVAEGVSAGEIIELSGIRALFPEIEEKPVVGIFSRKIALESPLENGDRLEIYRPLLADPKEVRRRKAEEQKNKAKSDRTKPLLN